MLKGIIDRIRRNHGLEHATVALMLAHQGPMRIVGRSDHGGFYIYANIETERLRSYAEEALVRLQRGEEHLAVSPMCGTNIAVAGVLAGFTSYLALRSSDGHVDGITRAILASLVSVVASQPLGRLVQKYATTSPELAGVRITSVDRLSDRIHKVRTASA
ncbi:MAG: hypothetical protein J4O14_07975 [Chloroflexi bacterium]|nr:hypothetical protein [Chloroflexota bacterium]MCI0784049.1 hypothetical protein [Chloroflexota bacterium]MCI0814100.1 hypothetical protein [Chloroflexota bacterium]MCI0818193.1 hypothetical protein [Chloroflexota bacterium]MCI0819652.1 hypothetical protein [Chloroflexota bacterium]